MDSVKLAYFKKEVKKARDNGARFRTINIHHDVYFNYLFHDANGAKITACIVPFRFNDTGLEIGGRVYEDKVGFSFCSPRDNHTKIFGQFLALQRATSPILELYPLPIKGKLEAIKLYCIEEARRLGIHWMENITINDLI